MLKKQTKIVATVSSLRCSADFIRDLYEHGVDVIRINTAHQGHEDSLKTIKIIRQVSERIAILLDTKGPEMRVTALDEEIVLTKGDTVKISGTDSSEKSSPAMVYINYAQFAKELSVGTEILIDDGDIGLKVIEKKKDYLLCRAENSGSIKSNKSVNVPTVHVNLPSISKKDRDYIDFAIKHDLDFIAHSFIRNKEDILAIQRILDKHKSKIKIIAKIENREGVDNIDEILDHAYGVMVARGDLGVEIPAEEIPLIQKKLIQKCIARHKPVITATQMMHSMIKNPRPTRAEVSDVANAILDGTDAIMLSGETANGAYPVEAVKTMSRIIRHTEANTEMSHHHLHSSHHEKNTSHYLAKIAVDAARELDAKEIVVCSPTGISAGMIASYRGRVPVFVKCFDQRTARELALTYGVTAHFVKKETDDKKFIQYLFSDLIKKGKLKTDDKVIYLSNRLKNNPAANFMEVCEVKDYIKTKTTKK